MKTRYWFYIVLLIAAGVFYWWSLGYRAEHCHADDMDRGQQFLCDWLGGR